MPRSTKTQDLQDLLREKTANFANRSHEKSQMMPILCNKTSLINWSNHKFRRSLAEKRPFR